MESIEVRRDESGAIDRFLGDRIDEVKASATQYRQPSPQRMLQHLRIARPVSDLARSVRMYCNGLGWHLLGEFADHDGFDGVMVGNADAPYHFEFTLKRVEGVVPTPTAEDLVVLYLPMVDEWQSLCASLVAAGFVQVASANPYWSSRGRTFQDPDGYRVVLQNASWS